MDLEGSGRRKGFGNIFARVLFIAVKAVALTLRIDLVDEVVLIGECQAFAAIDRDLSRMKGAAPLDDGVRLVGGQGWRGSQYDKRQQFSHRSEPGDSPSG